MAHTDEVEVDENEVAEREVDEEDLEGLEVEDAEPEPLEEVEEGTVDELDAVADRLVELRDIEESLTDVIDRETGIEELEVEDEDLTERTLRRLIAAGEVAVPLAPRRADEFLCTSCFLVKSRRQLADPERQLCGDCVS